MAEISETSGAPSSSTPLGENETELVDLLTGFCGKKEGASEILLEWFDCLASTIGRYEEVKSLTAEEVCGTILQHIMQCQDECLAFPSEYGKDLLDYQRTAVQHIILNPGLITAFATGTGKTLVAVSTSACIHYLCKFLSKPIQIVVVTPASLVTNMENEFKKFPYFMRNPGAYIVVGSEMFRRNVIAQDYAQDMKRYEDEFAHTPGLGKKLYYQNYPERGKLMDQQLFSKSGAIPLDQNTLLIVDEAHEFKTDWDFTFHEAEFGGEDVDSETRAKIFMEKCVPKVWKILLMTATPTLNRWYDILNLISAVKDIPRSAYPSAISSVPNNQIPRHLQSLVPYLSREQCYVIGNVYISPPDASKPGEDLSRKPVGNFTMRYPVIIKPELFRGAVMYRDVNYESGDFPTRTDTYVHAVMSRQFYDSYMSTVAEHKRSNAVYANADAVSEKLAKQAVTLQRRVATLPGNPKNELLRNYLREGNYKKIAIYSRFVGPLKGLQEYLAADAKTGGYTIGMISGELSKPKRDELLKTFNESEKFIILLSDAGGIGLDFKGINLSIVYEPGVNESREEQFIGRAVRYRSHHHLPLEERKVLVVRLVMMFPPNTMNFKNSERTPDQTLVASTLVKAAEARFFTNQLKMIG